MWFLFKKKYLNLNYKLEMTKHIYCILEELIMQSLYSCPFIHYIFWIKNDIDIEKAIFFFLGRLVCQYDKGDWSECDPNTKTKQRTLTLKDGSDASCPATKPQTRECKGENKGEFFFFFTFRGGVKQSTKKKENLLIWIRTFSFLTDFVFPGTFKIRSFTHFEDVKM